ncbi:MAG: N-acetylmuramoyl-L-alanine amidase [Alphaproteobacteria bacterium]|nr:N-acetylmuramoyl-L-alanine amidase [Alphaproteobacteria bacterium]
MKLSQSPNFNKRTAPNGVSYVVVHYTGMRDAQSAIRRMCDPHSEVSAHYVIEEDGALLQLVDESKRAWHAGKSFWKGERDLNSLSIGIELVNPGHEFGYRPFPREQISALKGLLGDLYARHALLPQSLLAHSDIAPMRRQDPGELFPWRDLAAHGYGLWPIEQMEIAQQNGMPPTFTQTRINALLRQIGYECPDTDETLAQGAQTAFLRRYHPEQLKRGFSTESFARLNDLAGRG